MPKRQIPLLNINMPAAEVDKKSPHSPVFEEKSRRDENIVVRTWQKKKYKK